MSLQAQPLKGRNLGQKGKPTPKVNWVREKTSSPCCGPSTPLPDRGLTARKVGEAALARGSEMAALGDIKASL